MILVGGRDWVVYSLDAAAAAFPAPTPGAPAAAKTPWPQSGHDARHSGRTDAAPSGGQRRAPCPEPRLPVPRALAGRPRARGHPASPGRHRPPHLFPLPRQEHLLRGADARRCRGHGPHQPLTRRTRSSSTISPISALPPRGCWPVSDPPRPAPPSSMRSTRRPTAWPSPPRSRRWAPLQATATGAPSGRSCGHSPAGRVFRRTIASHPRSPDAIGRIAVYEGTLGEPAAVATLLDISQGGYDLAVRAAAQSVLQGELKTDILNEEE